MEIHILRTLTSPTGALVTLSSVPQDLAAVHHLSHHLSANINPVLNQKPTTPSTTTTTYVAHPLYTPIPPSSRSPGVTCLPLLTLSKCPSCRASQLNNSNQAAFFSSPPPLTRITQEDRVVIITAKGSIRARKEEQQVLEIGGVNLKTVTDTEGADFQRTYSSSCVEIFNVLGIEAARATIMKGPKFDGSYVDYQHLPLLCDLTTRRGTLMAITQHCINRADAGALMRCSFEKTVKILMEAAAVGEKDDCHGVAESVVFGQIAPMGTGSFNVHLGVDILTVVIIVDHWLPAQNMLAVHKDGGTTPGQVAFDSNPLTRHDASFRAEAVAFSPLAVNGGDDPANFSYFIRNLEFYLFRGYALIMYVIC